MAIGATASTTGTGNQTTGTTLTMTVTGANIAIGDLIVVFIAADNQGASGASSISGVVDSGSNSYTQIKLQNRTAASAVADGCTCAIYAVKATTALTSGSSTITVNFSPTTVAKAISYQAFAGVNVATGTAVSSSGSGATYDSLATASMSIGQLVVAAAANESVTPPAADSDTAGGAWNGTTYNSAGSGGDATKMALRTGWKIVNAAGTQRFNGATGASTDWAAVAAMYSAATFPWTSRGRIAWS